ncbi:MAG TPA: hypothetical protein VGD22_20540 [Sphingobacteriaceae bacterium]
MKRTVYPLLAFFFLFIYGCEKQTGKPDLNQLLPGEWEFIKAVGGLTGNQVILPPAGTKTTLIFSPDHKYKKNNNGQTFEQGSYDLIMVTSIFTGQPDDAIRFNDFSSQNEQLISIENDSLWITDNHVEPFGYLYIKLK